MSVSDEFRDYILDQLRALENITVRRMFGGAGVFQAGKIFAVIAQDIIYFKVDNSNIDDYRNAGSVQFKPFENKDMMMPYFQVPHGVLEDSDELCRWALKSLAVPSSKKGIKK